MHFTCGNTCALFLLALKVLQTFIMVVFTSNISKEYDLKDSTQNTKGHGDWHKEEIDDTKWPTSVEPDIEENTSGRFDRLSNPPDTNDICENVSSGNSNDVEVRTCDGNVAGTRSVLVKMLRTPDILLLLLLTPIAEFWQSVFYRSIPVVVLETLHFKNSVLSIFYVRYSVIFMVFLYLVINVSLGDNHIFTIGVLSSSLCSLSGYVAGSYPTRFQRTPTMFC